MLENKEMICVDLPFDLTAEILSRLPAKSVVRFKSVCKTWHALIETPTFVEKHRKSNPNTTTILVASFQKLYLKDESFYKPVDIDFSALFEPDLACLCIMGICSGLVCLSLSLYESSFVICNPTTREFRQLPSHKVLTTESDIVFFGFSSFSNEFKLFRVIYRISVTGEVIVRAEVYTMSTDIWIEIDVKVGCLNTVDRLNDFYGDIPVILNGVLYWKARSSSDARVSSFDTSLGIFYEISIPASIVDLEEHNWVPIEFEEELSLIVYTREWKFELWILDEHRNSWTWKLRIEDFPILAGPLEIFVGRITVVGYMSSGELLVEDRNGNDWKVFLYNLKSRETKILPLFDLNGADNAYFYAESLLSVKPSNEVAESD